MMPPRLKRYLEEVYSSGTANERAVARTVQRLLCEVPAAKTALEYFADDVESSLCPRCNGSGEQQFMTAEHGPEDYEVTGDCGRCGGTGAFIMFQPKQGGQ